jgi:hypothetical protein
MTTFWIDINSPYNGFNFKSAVLNNLKVEYPYEVARIMATPHWPTGHQDALVWVIVPYVREKDMQWAFSDMWINAFLIDMRTWNYHTHSQDTLLVSPQGFVNSIILACLHYFQAWKLDIAVNMMNYIREIMPYLKNASIIWTLSPQEKDSPLVVVGIIENDQQRDDPYKYQDAIFPLSPIPWTLLS